MRVLGWMVLFAGIALGGYAMFVYDPSVATDYGRVVNIERLDYRRNLLLVSGVAIIGGLLVALLTPKPKEHPFREAMLVNDLSTMESMIRTGAAEVDGRTSRGWTWLREAVERCDVPQATLLMKFGADPDRPTNEHFYSPRMFVSDKAKYGPKRFIELQALMDKHPQADRKVSPEEAATT